MFWQQPTSRLAQAAFGAVSLNRPADLLGRRKPNPDSAIRFTAARLDQYAALGCTKTGAHEQKLRAFGQSLHDYWEWGSRGVGQ